MIRPLLLLLLELHCGSLPEMRTVMMVITVKIIMVMIVMMIMIIMVMIVMVMFLLLLAKT